ncbi:MAG: hypothetical protein IBV52_01860 [Candidatus Bathyarchaeota archaeon]
MTKHKFYTLTLVLIPFSLWGGFFIILLGEGRYNPLAGLGIITIISVIIYFVALYQISKVEKHSEV